MLVIALAVYFGIGRPIFFRQKRVGYKGKVFSIYKFRTMSDARDTYGRLLPDNDRLCNFGKKLRATSLDELPQLFNILKGEMSFVGPRPYTTEEASGFYTSNQITQRQQAKPGITGLAQVKGRNALPFHHRIKYDLYYIKNRSLWLDIKILITTIDVVLKRAGITKHYHLDTTVPFQEVNTAAQEAKALAHAESKRSLREA